MSSARRAESRPDGGQTLVEFALIAPAFVLLMLGLLDFGRVVYADHTLSQAAREGLRVAIVEPAESSSKYAAIRAAAVNAAPGTGLAAANVTGSGCGDCFYPDGNVSGGRVVVTVARNVELLTPIIGQLLGGSMPVEARSMGFLP